MTAPVISLDSQRLKRRPAPGCQRCEARTDGTRCFPHQLDALAVRLRTERAEHEGELLIPADDLAETWAEALAVLDGITAECLTPTERTTAK